MSVVCSPVSSIGIDAMSSTLQFSVIFLQSSRGVSNLWELVDIVMGMTDDRLSPEYSQGIMHMKHLAKFKSVHLYIVSLYIHAYLVVFNISIY